MSNRLEIITKNNKKEYILNGKKMNNVRGFCVYPIYCAEIRNDGVKALLEIEIHSIEYKP